MQEALCIRVSKSIWNWGNKRREEFAYSYFRKREQEKGRAYFLRILSRKFKETRRVNKKLSCKNSHCNISKIPLNSYRFWQQMRTTMKNSMVGRWNQICTTIPHLINYKWSQLYLWDKMNWRSCVLLR